jgi:hypothetical protein
VAQQALAHVGLYLTDRTKINRTVSARKNSSFFVKRLSEVRPAKVQFKGWIQNFYHFKINFSKF